MQNSKATWTEAEQTMSRTNTAARYRVIGVHCEGCTTKIERAVGLLEGVEDTALSAAAVTLTVTSRDGSPPSGSVEHVVRQLGYEIERIAG